MFIYIFMSFFKIFILQLSVSQYEFTAPRFCPKFFKDTLETKMHWYHEVPLLCINT